MRALQLGLGIVCLVGVALAACSSSPKPTSFHADIAPIVQSRCQSCHHDGGIAPFSLVSYDDLRSRGHLALSNVTSRTMPPWGAFDSPECKLKRPLADDLRLTDAEVATFEKWVNEGMVEGDPASAPAPKQFTTAAFTATNDYGIIKPFGLKAGTLDTIRCFPIDPGFTQDVWIAGSNVVPGDPRVVHHVIVYQDPNGEGPAKADETGSYSCFGGPGVSNTSLMVAWAPGVPPASYGENAGMKLKKGSRLVLQVHYHPAAVGQDAVDATRFQLRVLQERPRYVTQIVLIGNAENADGIVKLLPSADDPPAGPAFLIPANKTGHVESMTLTVPEKLGSAYVPTMKLFALGAHMHWAGVDMKIEIDRAHPTEEQPPNECLLQTAKYDFNWQRAYAYTGDYDTLPEIGPNDRLKFTCTYNNTTNNRYITKALSEQRLSSPVDIHLGETTLDEMCLGAFVLMRPVSAFD